MSTKKTVKKPVKKVVKKASEFKVTLSVLGKVYESKGKTLIEAIDKMTVPMIKSVGVFTAEHGENKKERIFPATVLRRVFYKGSPTTKSIAMKGFVGMFDNLDK